MKQPLMLTVSRIPPAQAEALYDASLNTAWNDETGERSLTMSQAAWPGEDWDDETDVDTTNDGRSPRVRTSRASAA